MASKKVGVLVKEARTAAGLTQEKLADQVGGDLTAKDISNCENGKDDLTNAQLKKIAVLCGVTQKSLLEAPKNISASAKKAAKKTESTEKKTSASKKTASAKKAEANEKKTAKKAATPANANTSMKVTATEKKLVEAYREATSDNRKIALKVLKGEYGETLTNLLGVAGGSSTATADNLGELIGNVVGSLFGGK